jgi:hypothetical protein
MISDREGTLSGFSEGPGPFDRRLLGRLLLPLLTVATGVVVGGGRALLLEVCIRDDDMLEVVRPTENACAGGSSSSEEHRDAARKVEKQRTFMVVCSVESGASELSLVVVLHFRLMSSVDRILNMPVASARSKWKGGRWDVVCFFDPRSSAHILCPFDGFLLDFNQPICRSLQATSFSLSSTQNNIFRTLTKIHFNLVEMAIRNPDLTSMS